MTDESVAEAAWQIHQKYAHLDYIGAYASNRELFENLASLALLIHRLAGEKESE